MADAKLRHAITFAAVRLLDGRDQIGHRSVRNPITLKRLSGCHTRYLQLALGALAGLGRGMPQKLAVLAALATLPSQTCGRA
jgi:hypothetical protein